MCHEAEPELTQKTQVISVLEVNNSYLHTAFINRTNCHVILQYMYTLCNFQLGQIHVCPQTFNASV